MEFPSRIGYSVTSTWHTFVAGPDFRVLLLSLAVFPFISIGTMKKGVISAKISLVSPS